MFKQFKKSLLYKHSGIKAALNRIKKIHQEFRTEGEIQNFQLLGASGLGKTTLALNYVQEFPPYWDNDVRVTPVVYFKIPSAPTQRSVFAAMVGDGFGGPVVGTADDLMSRALMYAKRCRCEMLFVDEAHHFLDRGQHRTHAQSGDFWKVFHDEFPGIICFLGAPRVRRLLAINNQWRNRAGEEIILRPFSYNDYEEDLGAYMASLAQNTMVEQHMAFLADGDTLMRIQYATDGVPAEVTRLMKRVDRFVRSGRTMSMHLLDEIWSYSPGTSHLPNSRRPFRAEFDFHRLSQPGEPYFPGALDGDNHAYSF